MNRNATLVAAVAVLVGTPALAADMAVKSPPPPASAPYSWTGFYVGGNAGYAQTRADFTSTIDPGNGFYVPSSLPVIDSFGTGSTTRNGFTFGGQLGYNWQWKEWVLGIEADMNALGGAASLNSLGPDGNGSVVGVANAERPNWIATVRPRLGYATDRLLVYATGGLAVLNTKYSLSYAESLFGGPFVNTNATTSTTKAGWTAGGGVEYSLTKKWSIRAQYLYARFAGLNENATVIPGPGFANPLIVQGKVAIAMTSAGLNYHF